MLIDEFIERLEGVRSVSLGRWMARCPAHDDSQASLSVTEGRDGRTLIKCFAGCEVEDVVEAVGLGLRDLFPRPLVRDPMKSEREALGFLWRLRRR